MKWRAAAGAFVLAILPAMLPAGPFNESEAALRFAYGHYRTALFQSNAGKAEPTMAAIVALSGSWAALQAEWTSEPPPQYMDDPELGATFVSVASMIDIAAEEAAAGKLDLAHETLEGIRDAIGSLHARNGVIGFSDRMNAYHAVMEEILSAGGVEAESLGLLREQAAVLKYLAEDIAAHPAPEAADPAYTPLVQDLLASVAALLKTTRAGDLEAVQAAIGALKMPYAKLFSKFG